MPTDLTPTIDQFRPATLGVLADGQERSVAEIVELVAEHMRLSDEVLAELVPSGQPRYANRINWALSSFAKAALVERPRRGHYRITDDGRAVARRGLSSYSERDMLEWPQWRAYQEEIKARKDTQDVTAQGGDGVVDPIETMLDAERSFNAQTETDLRRRLQNADPAFFERAVVDLLWAMGYGGTHGEKQRVGKSGDGGIDGVIRQDALGLSNIYIQAKRYADTNKVSDPEIRNFIGALDTRGANLGVFITTSTFQPRAIKTAAGYRHGKIVLIDGIKLTELMLAYGVGVQKAHEFTLYEMDEDFFSDELG
ncbi:restriction endonuclease [Trueperella pecoris]|uniref:Restriction endonuclease n=1 Tax=Trueperella pecoris TaxID=2733571 RepID=A0A7M1QV03_9ACTO|nr:restriction endonuclease [Trueperella pecoris]QOR45972.1 restriction endonuclease [Trueperella pecoris]